MIDRSLQDLRFAVRALRQSPVVTAVAVLTLALGIGANTAVFSVVNAVLLRPLPYDDPRQLMVVWTNFGPDLPQNWISGPEFEEIRELNSSLESFAVVDVATAALAGDGRPEQVGAGVVSGEFFRVFRASSQVGRLIGPPDDVPGGDQVAVVSDGFWKRRLGSDPDVVGTEIRLDGDPFTIVGVLMPDFRLHHPNIADPDSMEIWLPFQPTYATRYDEMGRGSHFLIGIGRARDGWTVEQVQADLDAVASRMSEVNAGEYDFEGWGLTAYSLHEDLVEPARGALVVLLGAVGFVLLIACVNVANLQIARAAVRRREMAVRSAMGASHRRLLGQLLTESMVLAIVGATLGLALAWAMTRGLLQAVPEGLPRAASIGLEPAVLAFTAGLAVLTALLFGLAPGLVAYRGDLVTSLKAGGRGSTAGRGAGVRTGLVVAEVALALVLLVGAGLMVRSMGELLASDPGFASDSRLTLRVSLPGGAYDGTSGRAFWTTLVEEVEALPGVIAADAVSSLPLSGYGGSGSTLAEESERVERNPHAPHPFIEADRRFVTEGYYETMGIPVLRGRGFTAADHEDGAPVAVVDETFARRFWGDDEPLGRRVAIGWSTDPDTGEPLVDWREVVGVVRHVRHQDLASDGREQIYLPFRQMPRLGMHLVVRTDGDPTAVAGAVRDRVWELDPELPVADLRTMEERVSSAVAGPRFNSLLLGAFAAMALLLSAIGIYGVIAFSVGQRLKEIGVRMALGASEGNVRRMVLRRSLAIVVVGLGLGALAALGLSRFLGSMLYAVSPTDPATYVVVAGMLTAVATLASWIPAARATRVDPVRALREE